ncbi:MAG TPA: PilW family protein [Pseudomonadales bacterium]
MKKPNINAIAQHGFTLIELLVSMLVGLIIMAGVVQVFQGNFINARYQDNMALLQENGRFTMAMLTRQFQMAGYSGCMTKNVKINNTLNDASFDASFNPDIGIEGWEYKNTYYTAPQTTEYPFAYLLTANQLVSTTNGDWADSLGVPPFNIQAVPGSDIFRIWGGAGMGVTVDGISPGANTVLTVNDVSSIPQDSILLLNNCAKADLVQACNVNSSTKNIILSAGCTPGNIAAAHLNVTVGAGVYVLQGNLYYVGRRNDDAANPPSLFVRALGTNSGLAAGQELVEGIENIQIMYGVDTSTDQSADVYVTAKQIDTVNWEKVVSVRVTVMTGSVEDNIISDPMPIFYNGATSTPTDRRVRQVFTKTITLRNRAF